MHGDKELVSGWERERVDEINGKQQRCPDNSAPVYDPGRFSPPQLDTPPPPVLNTQEQSDFNLGSSSGDMFSSFEKHNNNCWSSNAKLNNVGLF
ncbi:hypothetical protein Aduo_014356 [Ancylostoma duodenale]